MPIMKKIYITSILAHIDHGKTTLIDSLLATNNIISSSCAGDIRYMDSRTDEQIRGITLKLSIATIERQENFCDSIITNVNTNIEQQCLVDHIIIDTPGHVDFESLIQISGFMSSSFILIIDVNEGITPRIYSLISHIEPNKTVLVLNKIDKLLQNDNIEDIYYYLLGIVSKLNDLIGINIFDWDMNNIVIAWSTMCAGVSHKDLIRIINNGDLMNGIKLFKEIKKRIETGKTDKIIKKYKITKKGEKNIWMGVMPLSDAILDCIEKINKGNEYCTKKKNAEDNEKIEDKRRINEQFEKMSICERDIDENLSKLEYTPQYNLIDNEALINQCLHFFGITMYSTLTDCKLIRENVLFVTRIFTGKLKKGDMITCKNKQGVKEVRVEAIYVYNKNEMKEVEQICGTNVVALKGDISKQSILYKFKSNNNECYNSNYNRVNESTSQKNKNIFLLDNMEHKNVLNNILDNLLNKYTLNNKPFYKSCITLTKENKEEFIEALKIISYLEPVYKAKRNKYGDFEIFCEGRVQFEKITNDLIENGFDFNIQENTNIFVETALECNVIEKNNIFCAIIPKQITNENINYKKILQKIKNKIDKRKNNEEYSGNGTTKNIIYSTKDTLSQNENGKNIKNNEKNALLKKTSIEKLPTLENTYSSDTNTLHFCENKHKGTIISVFEQFISKGLLINEKVHNLDVVMFLDDDYDNDDAFQTLKKIISQAYLDASCAIIPLYYLCKIRSLPKYISQVYSSLGKFYYILQNETFDEVTEFYALTTLIPQFLYYQFVEEIRMKSKGTVYLEAQEYGFVYNTKADFSYLINDIRKEKGMFVEEKIVADPEKQRTLKK